MAFTIGNATALPLISVRFVFRLFIDVDFGSVTLSRLFDSISAHFWFNKVLYFSLKNLFEKPRLRART